MSEKYFKLNYLPSHFLPYSVNEISLRPLLFREVEVFTELEGRPVEILDFIESTNVIKGIPIEELTFDDWRFIELTLTSISFPSVQYRITSGECPKCAQSPKTIELQTGGGTKLVEIRPELKLVLLPSDISFDEIGDEVELPIEAVLSTGDTNFDFYRVKHYKELYKNDLLKNEYQKLKMLCDNPSDEFTFEDVSVLKYLFSILSHGPKSEYTLICPECKVEYRITTVWEVADFIPFRLDKESIRTRVRFGKGTKSANKSNRGLGISESIRSV